MLLSAHLGAKLRKVERKTKEFIHFFAETEELSHLLMAKLRKKLVKSNGFWKINAIRPKIKAKRGRTRKYENVGNAKYGGLVKELGF